MSGADPQRASRQERVRPPVSRARLFGIGLVAVGLAAGAGAATARAAGGPRAALQPAAVAAEAAPVGSQSSSWYCTGGTGAAGHTATPGATTTIVLANAGSRQVTGTVDVVDGQGQRGTRRFVIPPDGQIDERPGTVLAGAWLAARVNVQGGGVTASELLDAPSGPATIPCASETSPRWYFAQATTVRGAALFVSLFNPTANLAVVDLSFHTASGLVAPAPDQGIVVDPGQLVTVTVGQYVQYKPEVATVVSTRSGAVTAAELQIYEVGGVTGTALVPGVPAPSHRWELPHLLDVAGGASDIAVLNPSPSVPAHVTVAVHLPTGTAAPFQAVVAPSSVWTLETSAQLRIPTGVDYSLEVTATGGTGVVVGRIGAGTAQSAAPQWGSQVGITAPFATASSATRWLVPSLASGPIPQKTAGTGSATGSSPTVTSPPTTAGPGGVVVLDNPGAAARRASVRAMTGTGIKVIGTVHLAPHATATLGAGTGPLLVDANGPLAIEEVGTPTGAAGVVAFSAVRQR